MMIDCNTVLIVDDDKLTRVLLKEALGIENFCILEAANGERAVNILKEHRVDAILLDFYFPQSVGTDFIPDIRHITMAPIVMVSGDRRDDTKIDCLNCGADDFISKPFNADMLTAKIGAHIRRYKDSANAYSAQNVVTIGDWSLDLEKFQIFDGQGTSANLTTQEFQIFSFLVKNGGRALTRNELCDALCEQNYTPTPRSVDIKIARIRKKIRDDVSDSQIIQTIRGIGYMVAVPT